MTSQKLSQTENSTSPRWCPLHQHSNYSLLDGFGRIDDIAKTCKDYGYRAAALTDHGSVSGHVKFFKECKKNDIKPILGCEFYFNPGDAKDKSASNRTLFHVLIYAKNLNGWYKLINCVSDSNSKDRYYYKPRIDYTLMHERFEGGDNFCITGHPGTYLSDSLFTSSDVYRCETPEDAETFLKPDWKTTAVNIIEEHISIFGEDNVFVEIQLIDTENLPMSVVVAKCLREIVAESNGRYRPVATADSHYVRKSDAIYQRILLCSNLGRTLPAITRDINAGKDVPLGTFFVSDNYHIPTFPEMLMMHTEEELTNSLLIADMCEDYNILSKPILPKFECPDNQNSIDYLKSLCRAGWMNKLSPEQRKNETYINRVKEELAVIEDADLAGYFLIVWDIIKFCHDKGQMTGVGRGSAAGCLVSYLLGITGIDPIPYGLLFSRFFNAGRKGSLPDIDLDIPSNFRENVIQYLKNKYGEPNVTQIATFGSLMGRSALKEVLRIEDVVSATEMDEITKSIPDESEIADELEQMEDSSIIKWSLINRAKKLAPWCTMSDDGSLSGPLANQFARAMVIEGTYKSQGKHPAGVVISSEPLASICPMGRDKDDKPLALFEMGDLEALGHVKFDVLAVSVLDKLMCIVPYLPKGKSIHDFKDQETWELLSEGDTKGVFQLEKQKKWTKKLRPSSIDHLAALVAIIRPGVIEALEDNKSMTLHYIDRKNGEEEIPLMHESVDPILRGTYGVLVYQETAMALAKEIAGFTLDEADELRKAAGKKLPEVMAKVKTKFIEGSKKTGKAPEEIYTKIFDWIEKSQRYSFNASHSYGYGHVAFYTAYCKTHARLKFYETYLNYARSKPKPVEEIRELVNDARLHNIEVHPPCLSHFYEDFTMNSNTNEIFCGIGHVKNVGKEADKCMLIKESVGDLDKLSWIEILVHFNNVNQKAMKSLISVGAFSGSYNQLSRNQMLYEYDNFHRLTDGEVKYIANNIEKDENLLYHINKLINNHRITAKRMVTILGLKKTLEDPTHDTTDSQAWIAQTERFHIGVPLSKNVGSPDDSAQWIDASCLDIASGNLSGPATIGVTISNIKEHKIKAGKSAGQLMCFLDVEDTTGCLSSVILFPKEYNEFKHLLIQDNSVMIAGNVNTRQGELSFIVNKVLQI